LSTGADSIIPSSFSQRVPENLVTIIQWLVENDASKRPSTLELQNSPLMPPRIELDKLYLEEVMSVLRHNSDTVQSVITTLFTRKHPVNGGGGHVHGDREGSDDLISNSNSSSYSTHNNNYHFNYDFDLYSRSLRLVNPVLAPVLALPPSGSQRQAHAYSPHPPHPNHYLPLEQHWAWGGGGYSGTAPLQLHDAIASLAEKVKEATLK
jgi:hypothetical protein